MKAHHGVCLRRPILVDTREQLAWFADPGSLAPHQVTARRATLATGDYTLEGAEQLVLIERKSLPDLAACIGRERGRFERELVRLRDTCASPWLFIEADASHVAARCAEIGQVSPAAMVGSLLAWSVDYRVHVWWAGSHRLAELAALRLLAAVERRVDRQEKEVRQP